jgi:phospholipid/cholesterol/gamma-HCH transport system substrate-binding protein
MDKKKVYLKVGITVIASILILLYGLAFLKEFRIGITENKLTVYFSEINGLKEGDIVSVNGVTKGKVLSINLNGDSVKVDFTLSKDVNLKKDCKIQVSMIELMSGKQISIKPGRSNELADISKPLLGEKTSDVVSLIETLNDVGTDVKEISVKINKTTDELVKTTKNINDLIGDENFKSNIKSTASNFNSASRNLDLLITENKINLSQLTLKLNKIANNFDETISENRPELKQTFKDIQDLTAKIDTLTTNLNQIVVSTRDSNSTVSKLMTQDELYDNLVITVTSINKLINKINKEGIKLKIF